MEQQQQQARPRSKSTFSFKSDKSHHSHKHEKHAKENLKETHAEKAKTHLTSGSHANPNAAINEAQPIAAALEKPTLQSLRSFQHTDSNGNPITEPDLSNPTRSRWERPLDTIRSFEAAIDNEYRRRTSALRPESTMEPMNGYASRRSSYYGGHDQNRYSHAAGFYANRQNGVARDSWAENGQGPVGPPRSRYQQRMQQPEPAWARSNNGHGVYPTQGYQQSRDTVHTGGSNGSHQSEPYLTDPNSSENSSIERGPPMAKPDLGEQYGFTGFGGAPQFQGPILQEFNAPGYGRAREGSANAGDYFQGYQGGSNGAPAVPAKNGPPARGNVIKLDSSSNPQYGGARPPVSGTDSNKRKSWFKRRFSKD